MSIILKEWNLSCKVYIGNLGDKSSKEELADIFSRYGEIKEIWLAANPPRFAFIEFERERDAENAARALDASGGLSMIDTFSGKRAAEQGRGSFIRGRGDFFSRGRGDSLRSRGRGDYFRGQSDHPRGGRGGERSEHRDHRAGSGSDHVRERGGAHLRYREGYPRSREDHTGGRTIPDGDRGGDRLGARGPHFDQEVLSRERRDGGGRHSRERKEGYLQHDDRLSRDHSSRNGREFNHAKSYDRLESQHSRSHSHSEDRRKRSSPANDRRY